MGPRSWIATVLHGLSGALAALLLVAGPVVAQADTGWGGVAVVVGLAVAAFGTEMLARRVAPTDPATALAARRRGGLGLWMGLAVVLPQALSTALVVTGVALLGHSSVLVVAVGGITRVAGPVRRHVALAGDTFVAFVGTHHVVVRQGGRGVKLNLRAWGTGWNGNVPRRLHRALRLSGVPGTYDVLRHQPRVR